jgi:hypothetical protein
MIVESKIPVYMQKTHTDIPCSMEYPIDDVISELGDYFTNSISYMVALAIFLRYEEIYIHGVNMIHDSEYGHQKPSCEYYLGIARGRGLKVILPPESDLLKATTRYGYSAGNYGIQRNIYFKIKEYQSNIDKMNTAIQKQLLAIEQNQGAISALRYIIKTL